MTTLSLTRRASLATVAGWLAAPARATDFWSALRPPGSAVLLRHAQTEPGVGDPPGFTLGVCRSQRNLSEGGREQARRIGQAFAQAGLRPAEVRSSAWCRCIDTAELAFGRHRVWDALNSFFAERDAQAAQTHAVLAQLREWRGPAPLVLVTHQVNISALCGEFPAMGELFAVRSVGERLQVVARLVV